MHRPQDADDRLAGHLGTAARLKRERPERIVLVTGCLPQAEQAAFFERFPFVDGALGPQNLHRLPELLSVAVERAGAPAGYFSDGPELSGRLAARRERPFQAWVQVMSGCTNFCSYCIVPFVRGPERSRPLDEIVREVEALVADGVLEVTLLGQNVNAYGLDLRRGGDRGAADFAQLLARLDAIEGLARIRFMTSHPKDLGDDVIAAVAELPSVCEHVHLPAQAGSDRVLAAMRRGYTAEEYLGHVRALRKAVPGVSITTDLIAGFPGESDADFEATLELVRRPASTPPSPSSSRPCTGRRPPSCRGQVPAGVARERITALVAATQAGACGVAAPPSAAWPRCSSKGRVVTAR